MKLPVPSIMFCGTAMNGAASVTCRYTSVLSSIAKLTGRPSSTDAKNSATITSSAMLPWLPK